MKALVFCDCGRETLECKHVGWLAFDEAVVADGVAFDVFFFLPPLPIHGRDVIKTPQVITSCRKITGHLFCIYNFQHLRFPLSYILHERVM